MAVLMLRLAETGLQLSGFGREEKLLRFLLSCNNLVR